MKSPEKEKRKHTRLPISINAEIRMENGDVLKGLTKNISFSGILIETRDSEKLIPGETCNLFLLLNEEQRDPAIEFECRVVRRENFYVGMKYVAVVDVEGYMHFKNLMISNSGDPDRLLAELRTNPGIIVDNDISHP